MQQPILARQRLEHPAVVPTDSASLCADPQVALGILAQATHLVAGQPFRTRVARERPAVVAHQSSPIRADPQLPEPVFPQAGSAAIAQFRSGRYRLEPFIDKATDAPGAGGQPHPVLPVHGQTDHPIVDQPVPGGKHPPLPAVVAVHPAAAGGQPQPPLPILDQGPLAVVGTAFPLV